MTAIVPATALLQTRRPTRDHLRTGLPEIDQILDGLPRGAISEITGPQSSGKTTLLHRLLARSTNNLECAGVMDTMNRFDPKSSHRAGVRMERLLWVRCGGDTEKALKAVDLVLHAGGFGLLCLDLTGVPPRLLNRVPISYWYRFRRAVQDTQTVFLVLGEHPQAKSCAGCRFEFAPAKPIWRGAPGFRLLEGTHDSAQVLQQGQRNGIGFDSLNY